MKTRIPMRLRLGVETLPIGACAGSGRYRCVNCGEYVVQLRDPEDQLPPCENCGSHSDVCYVADNDEARWS